MGIGGGLESWGVGTCNGMGVVLGIVRGGWLELVCAEERYTLCHYAGCTG